MTVSSSFAVNVPSPLHAKPLTVVNPFYSRIICFQWAKDYGIDLLMHCEVTAATVEAGELTAVTVPLTVS